MHTLVDNPIDSEEEDTLGRSGFANALAHGVQAVDASEGYVFALLGPWGSGKTSLINLIRNDLVKMSEIPVIDFNPWMFSGSEALVDSFFHELAAQLRLKDPHKFSTIAEQIDKYSGLLTPLTFLPVVGPWAGRLKSATSISKMFQRTKTDSAQEQKNRLAKALSDLSQPIVMVIDDIDRLNRREIQDIFRLVRLTANFPNIIYLLAFDRQRVEDALSEEGMPGRNYLEKIVQTTWDLPATPEQVLLNQVTTALDKSLDVDQIERFDTERWSDTFMELIFPLIRNMRDVKRYVSSASTAVNALRDQAELGDILALEAVRVFLPDVFALLAQVQKSLTTPAGYNAQYESPALKKGIDELLAAASLDGHRDLAENLIRRLFPAGQRHFENNNFGSDWLNVWLRDRRVAHPDVLSLYLERTVPSGLVAFSDAERAISLLHDEDAFRAFLEPMPAERLRDVISALEAFEGEYPIEGIAPGIIPLLNALPRLPAQARGMFSLDPKFVVTRVVLRMLRQLDDPSAVEAAVRQALPKLNSLSIKRELIALVGYNEGVGHELISEDAASSLEREFTEEVLGASLEDLAHEDDLLWILLSPKAWSNRDPVTVRADAPPTVHAAVLRSAMSTMRSQAMGNRTVKMTSTLAWNPLLTIYGSEDAIEQAAQSLKGSGIEEVDEIIEVVERYRSGWRPDRH